MSIVEFDGPPSLCLDASKTGKSTKWLWAEVVGSFTTPTHGQFELSQFHLHQDTKMVNSTFDIYNLTEKKGTVNSLELSSVP